MLRVSPALTALAAVVVFGVAFALAEYAMRTQQAIPLPALFAVIGAVIGVAFLTFGHMRELIEGSRFELGSVLLWSSALVIAVGPAMVLGGKYHGGYDPRANRLAPDGSPVTSISWSETDGRFVEKLNGRFEIELTEAQYQEAMRQQQRPFLGAGVQFGYVVLVMSVAVVLIGRRTRRNGI